LRRCTCSRKTAKASINLCSTAERKTRLAPLHKQAEKVTKESQSGEVKSEGGCKRKKQQQKKQWSQRQKTTTNLA